MVGIARRGHLGFLEWAVAVVLGDFARAVCDDQHLVISILPESVASVCRDRSYNR